MKIYSENNIKIQEWMKNYNIFSLSMKGQAKLIDNLVGIKQYVNFRAKYLLT